tara:strand:+ start:405 stop:674 length:270 start_codon:yes stop_codon:yes gene_type:complete
MNGFGIIIRILFYIVIFTDIILIFFIMIDELDTDLFRRDYRHFGSIVFLLNLYFLLKSKEIILEKIKKNSIVGLWLEVQKKKLKDQLKK